jgi:hypothetical protein
MLRPLTCRKAIPRAVVVMLLYVVVLVNHHGRVAWLLRLSRVPIGWGVVHGLGRWVTILYVAIRHMRLEAWGRGPILGDDLTWGGLSILLRLGWWW